MARSIAFVVPLARLLGLAALSFSLSSCSASGTRRQSPTAPTVRVIEADAGSAPEWRVVRHVEGEFLRGVWASADDSVWAVGHGGTIVHWDGHAWSYSMQGALGILVDVWGSGPQDIWVVGVSGVILHGDGNQWSPVNSGTTQHLSGVWGSGKDEVWAVGEGGTILHWNGTHWAPSPSGTKAALRDVWGRSHDSAWSAGEEGTILRWDGGTWLPMPACSSTSFTGISVGDNGEAWAIGASAIAHWNGQLWSCEVGDFDLVAISSRRGTDTWAVGSKGTLRHWDGHRWTEASGVRHERLSAVSIGPSGTTWAVGYDGLVLRHSP